jgi:hypothetical protein
MILLITHFIINTLAFIFGWMIVTFFQSWFGFKVDWNSQWLMSTFCGIIFAFILMILR